MTLPSDLSLLADAFYVRQAETARQVATQVQRSFVAVPDPRVWRATQAAEATRTIRAGQLVAVTRAAGYVDLAAATQDAAAGARVNVSALVPDIESVDEMLARSLLVVDDAVAAGATIAEAKPLALRNVITLAASLVEDAGQNASGVAVAANPNLTGYYRKLRLPSCDRCAILAGRWYEWNEGFQRHPNCDCVHVPATKAHGDEFNPRAAILSGRVTGLSKADLEAIELGADPSQVVNIKGRGSLYDVGAGLQATTVRASDEPRLTPASILRISGSRVEAVRLLTRYGYIAA